MAKQRMVEVFTAGCGCCDEAVALVRRIACTACEVSVLDMKDESIARRARALGITRVPSVVIDGVLAGCCSGGVDEQTLRLAGLGSAA